MIAGGEFWMGCENFYPDERPIKRVAVDDFRIDATPVTNAQFRRFVEDTGYVTLAEKPPNPADYPGLDPSLAAPGSIVFEAPPGPVALERGNPTPWWVFRPGACWRRPHGSGSDLSGLDDHPVVHVVAADAEAYAAWAGRRLPSEAEWEYAARGGLDRATYAWGEDFSPQGREMARVWKGVFPWRNDARAGRTLTAPVGSYPPNPYGLFDMIGNVWEWTRDWYSGEPIGRTPCCGGARAAMLASRDRRAPGAAIPRRVLKGGSHLCAPNACRRYRPAARWPQPIDTATTHVGFRCAR
jgi:formylglycine-generating enzyme